MSRKIMDCRDTPSESNCTLTIAGEEEEVVKAAADHAVSVHGHKYSPELLGMIRTSLKDEEAPSVPLRNPGVEERPGMQ
jgi:predicted small metal-binding protein